MGVCRFHLTGRTYSYLEGIRLNCPIDRDCLIDRVSDGIYHPFSRISLSCRPGQVSHAGRVKSLIKAGSVGIS